MKIKKIIKYLKKVEKKNGNIEMTEDILQDIILNSGVILVDDGDKKKKKKKKKDKDKKKKDKKKDKKKKK